MYIAEVRCHHTNKTVERGGRERGEELTSEQSTPALVSDAQGKR